MKVSLVFLLLAVAYGADAMSVEKRDIQDGVDRITKLVREMSASLTDTTKDVVEKMKASEVASTAQNYMEGSKARMQPLVEKVQAGAAQLHEQLRPFIANIEDELKPLTQNVSAHVKPLTDMMETFFQQMVKHTKAMLPPAPQ
ncbi:antifreeze protein type IV [Brachionichthys hirsutus]|uniref:antifreeze protein type IV n=1 Tax=Brachionichthys hirsutus TaxID=412623 RepID=UPI003604DF4D